MFWGKKGSLKSLVQVEGSAPARRKCLDAASDSKNAWVFYSEPKLFIFFLAYLIKQPIGLSEGDFLARAIYSWGTGLILNPCWASPCYSPSDLATVLLVVHSMFSALCFPSPISNGALHTWWMSSRKTAWKINDNNAADDFPGPELDHEALVLADIGTEDASPERW